VIKRLWISAPLLFVVACGEDEPLQPPGQTPDSGVISDAGPVDFGLGDSGIDGGPLQDSGTTDTGTQDSGSGDAGFFPGETIDLPAINTGANGRSGEVTFELPTNVDSFMIVLNGPDDVTSIVHKLDGPGGVVVSDDASTLTQLEMLFLGPWGAQFKSPNRVLQDKGTSAALFPNNPNVDPEAGTYRMIISAGRIQGNNFVAYQGAIDATILIRRNNLASGRLGLHYYFSGAANIAAADAPTSPLITAATTRLGEIYASSNITFDAPTFHDVDPSYRTITGIDGTGDQLERLFQQSAGNGSGLHFFFVDRFDGGGLGGMVAGIAGGLPGPPLRPGTVNSGVAVALGAVNGDANVLAHVMAHEGGHWLGLFHVSEIIGTEDQLPDTPSGQAGDTYLMYPAVGGGTTVSPSQSEVVRRHLEVVSP
jgi:hypothetical protein